MNESSTARKLFDDRGGMMLISATGEVGSAAIVRNIRGTPEVFAAHIARLTLGIDLLKAQIAGMGGISKDEMERLVSAAVVAERARVAIIKFDGFDGTNVPRLEASGGKA